MAFCLYAGCLFCFNNAVTMHCVYMPDAILVICRMSLLLNNAVKVHCVYMPDAILSICRMSLLFNKNRQCELCLYVGCHSVYMPDVVCAKQKQ